MPISQIKNTFFALFMVASVAVARIRFLLLNFGMVFLNVLIGIVD